MIHMPPWWSPEKKAKFLAWLSDELSCDEERELLRFRAQGTEARRAETAQTDSVHDGPVAASHAPKRGNS